MKQVVRGVGLSLCSGKRKVIKGRVVRQKRVRPHSHNASLDHSLFTYHNDHRIRTYLSGPIARGWKCVLRDNRTFFYCTDLVCISEFRVAASGMGWKGVEAEGRTLLSSESIKWAQWLRVARNFQLRVGMKDRKRYTFDGFLREVSNT